MIRVFLGVLLVIVASVGWQYRHSDTVRNLINVNNAPLIPFKFDNGTVRQYDAAAKPGMGASATAQASAGIKKCTKGVAVTYTDGICPVGTREGALGGGTVTVVQVPGKARRSAPPDITSGSASGRSTLRDVLDISESVESLKEKQMQKTIGQ